MSLKEYVEQWQEGAALGQEGRYQDAIDVFLAMQEPGARIFFNVASMCLRLGFLADAEKNLDRCVKKDPHLALGFFQRGCLHLQNSRCDEAMEDFDMAMKTLRGNLLIDYKQLGLQYKLYSCEIIYNRAYTLAQMGRTSEAKEELQKAQEQAKDTSVNRHKIISKAVDNMRMGQNFMPYKLAKVNMLFFPPRNKTQVLQPMQFMKPATVLSSVVDQDTFTGFVGAQEPRGTSSTRPHSRSPSPQPHSAVVRHRSEPLLGQKITRAPKPSGPPPMPKPAGPPPSPSDMTVPSRNSSLKNGHGDRPREAAQPSRPGLGLRPPGPPPKPSSLPHTAERTKRGHSPSSDNVMTVKVHYTTTRAMKVSSSIALPQLVRLVCDKFDRPDGSLVLCHKLSSGELATLSSTADLRMASSSLEDGFRLTLWAYNSEEKQDLSLVLKEVVAHSDYAAAYDDELSFRLGDLIQVTADINSDWYEGRSGDITGIFPKSFVNDA